MYLIIRFGNLNWYQPVLILSEFLLVLYISMSCYSTVCFCWPPPTDRVRFYPPTLSRLGKTDKTVTGHYVYTYSNFAAVLEPGANIVQGVDGTLRADGHRLLVVLTEELVALVRFRCMSAILSEVKNCVTHKSTSIMYTCTNLYLKRREEKNTSILLLFSQTKRKNQSPN